MGWCKKDVTPLLMRWSYVFLALTHRYVLMILIAVLPIWLEYNITKTHFFQLILQVDM